MLVELLDMPIHIRLCEKERLLPSAKYQFIEIENATQTDVKFLDSMFLYEKTRLNTNGHVLTEMFKFADL